MAHPSRATGHRVLPGASLFLHPFSSREGSRGASFEAYGGHLVPARPYGYATRIEPPGGPVLVAARQDATGFRGATPAFDVYGSPIKVVAGPYSVEGDTWGAVLLAAIGAGAVLAARRRGR